MGTLLTTLSYPSWYSTQVALFSKDSLRATPALPFNPHQFLDSLKMKHGTKILGIELGGDKLTSQLYQVQDQQLTPISEFKMMYSEHGKGYLAELEKLAKSIDEDTLIGISFAGPLDHETHTLHAAPNMQEFFTEFTEGTYGGKLENLFHNPLTVVNDAVATIITASVHVARTDTRFTGLLLLIIGSGLGGAMWYQDKKGAHIIACEPGHIRVIPHLNPQEQTTPCQFLNKQICIENVASGKAGIESLYKQKKNQKITGEEISKRYQNGDKLATELYDVSANIVAHAIEGMVKTFRFSLQTTIIALHGGVTLVPDYSERVKQIIQRNIASNLSVIETKDITKHSGSMGAALATLIAD